MRQDIWFDDILPCTHPYTSHKHISLKKECSTCVYTSLNAQPIAYDYALITQNETQECMEYYLITDAHSHRNLYCRLATLHLL